MGGQLYKQAPLQLTVLMTADHRICTCNFITVLVKGTSTPFILAYI